MVSFITQSGLCAPSLPLPPCAHLTAWRVICKRTETRGLKWSRDRVSAGVQFECFHVARLKLFFPKEAAVETKEEIEPAIKLLICSCHSKEPLFTMCCFLMVFSFITMSWHRVCNIYNLITFLCHKETLRRTFVSVGGGSSLQNIDNITSIVFTCRIYLRLFLLHSDWIRFTRKCILVLEVSLNP